MSVGVVGLEVEQWLARVCYSGWGRLSVSPSR